MKFPFFASFIIFALVIRHRVKKQKQQNASQEQSFWERERQANSVRRKSLETVNYISIPLEQFPMNILSTDSRIIEYKEQITLLSSMPIVNLTGYSNTDLKLAYGVANITHLSECDQNYTLLVQILQKWANVLYDANYITEAATLMEFAISTHTDISQTYYKLAEIYAARGDFSHIHDLIETARQLRSANKNTIVRTLQESYL